MMQIFGGFVFLTGLGLWVGNASEAFCTSPMAGLITVAIGGVLLCAGTPRMRAEEQESSVS